MLVADLHNEDGRPSSICFQNIDLYTANHPDRCDEILGYCGVSYNPPLPGSATSNHTIYDERYHKAFIKGKKVSMRVVHLFNRKPQTKTQSGEVEDGHNAEMPFIYVGDTALVGGPPCDSPARDLEGINLYQKMKFHFSNASPQGGQGTFISAQQLHFSCPNLKAEKVLFPEHGNSIFDHVEIVSGVCLLSARIIRDSLQRNGQIDIQKLLYGKPTLYEMEYIARSSATVADVAAIITLQSNRSFQEQKERRPGVPVNITLDVPSFHYYQAVDDELERGLCTANEALQWLDAIELRYDQVAGVFEKAVRHELSLRGVKPPYPHGGGIHVSPRTNIVSSSIRQALQDGKRPSLNDILQTLSDQEDNTWPDFYRLLPMKERPQTFRALGHLFYVFQVVRPALLGRLRQSRGKLDLESSTPPTQQCSFSEESRRPRQLLISIDDSAERRIYSRAQKLLKKIRSLPDSSATAHATLVEMYMLQRVFINRNKTGSNLYLEDPTPEIPAMSTHSHVCNGDVSGCLSSPPAAILEPADIVSKIYGNVRTRNLQMWFDEVGL